MRTSKLIILCTVLVALNCVGAAFGQARDGAGPTSASSARPWILGAPATRPAVVPATQPKEKLPELTLKLDAQLGVLIVNLTNSTDKPITVDRELVLPLYFTFFNERDLPIRMDTLTGSDPERGDVEKRFAKLEPGQSVQRMIELASPFATWVSGTVTTTFDDEERQLAFGREKLRRLPPGSKVHRVQVVYAIMPADREAIPSYCEQPMEDLFAVPLTATLDLNAPPATREAQQPQESQAPQP